MTDRDRRTPVRVVCILNSEAPGSYMRMVAEREFALAKGRRPKDDDELRRWEERRKE